jgi:hypothetical protein
VLPQATPDPPPPQAEQSLETGYWQPYAEFAKTLRTWFVGYGVGAPAVVLTQAEVRRRFAEAGELKALGWLFLSGVLMQVLLAWVYKTSMWELYMSETNAARRKGWWHASALWISEATWLELSVDFATIVLFALATVIAFNVLTATSAR